MELQLYLHDLFDNTRNYVSDELNQLFLKHTIDIPNDLTTINVLFSHNKIQKSANLQELRLLFRNNTELSRDVQNKLNMNEDVLYTFKNAKILEIQYLDTVLYKL